MKASLTVEASLVITMTIIVLGIMISLWIYKFQVCWYTQAVSECLLTGSNQAVLYEEDYVKAIERKWKMIKEENYLMPQNLTVQIEGKKDKICMEISGKTSAWGYSPLQFKTKLETGVVRPVSYIRKIAAVKEVVGT